jgi:hypothetical protein
VEAELMNESNNVMRVERLDDKGKILSFIDIKFPPVANINSENDFIDDVLRPNIRNQIDGSLIFDSKGYFDIQYVTNDGLVVPYPTFINKQVSNFSFGYYALIEINIAENYAINFAVDNSIGPLLGYGARRFTKNDKSFYNLSATDKNYYKPTWYENNGFIKSQNKTIAINLINNINVQEFSNIFLRTAESVDQRYLFNIPSGYLTDHLAAERIDFELDRFGPFLTALRALYIIDGDGVIRCKYNYVQRNININSKVPITIDFGNQITNIFKGVGNNDSFVAGLGNNANGIYTNVTNKGIKYVPLVQSTQIVVNANNSNFTVNGQTFKVPWNAIFEETYEQNIVASDLGDGVTLVSSVYNEPNMFPYTRISAGIIEGSGFLTIDGSTFIIGDIILINSSNDKKINGLYVYDFSSALNKWRLTRLFNHTNPVIGDYVFVRYNKVYRNSDLRGNIKYDNTIFKLTSTNSTGAIVLDVHETYYTQITERFIPYAVDFISSWDAIFNTKMAADFYIGMKQPFPNTQYGVIMDGAGGVATPSGELYINSVPVQVGETILVNSADLLYNGVYKCVNNGTTFGVPWRLERLNYGNSIIVANDLSVNYPTPYFGLEENYENDIIANPVFDATPLVINGNTASVGDMFFVNGYVNNRYNGIYKCIDTCDGKISNRCKLLYFLMLGTFLIFS